ncbi:MAG: hypothetical protein AAF497_18880 [Planctomycetota bacterium]
MAQYEVKCDCGYVKTVSPTAAGSTLDCICGAQLKVPQLSKLRLAAGESAIPRDTLGQIRFMYGNGDLPANSACPFSNRPVDSTIELLVHCERPWIRGGEADPGIRAFARLLFGFVGGLITSRKPREEHGRDTHLTLPIAISSEANRLASTCRNQRKWKRILRETPIYAKLLDEYPDATITPKASL